jgi:hypothetical protein
VETTSDPETARGPEAIAVVVELGPSREPDLATEAAPPATAAAEDIAGKLEAPLRRRGGRGPRDRKTEAVPSPAPRIAQIEPPAAAGGTDPAPEETTVQVAMATIEDTIAKHETRRRRRGVRTLRDRKAEPVSQQVARIQPAATDEAELPQEPEIEAKPEIPSPAPSLALPPEAAVTKTRKPAARSRRPRKTETTVDGTG